MFQSVAVQEDIKAIHSIIALVPIQVSGCVTAKPHTFNDKFRYAEEQCHPSPCGQNTKCEVISGVPTCSCLAGFTGSPLSGCRHECESDGECGGQEMCKDFRCTSSCGQCGTGAQCSRVQNHRAVCECPKVRVYNANE